MDEEFCEHIEALIDLMEEHLSCRPDPPAEGMTVDCGTCGRSYHFKRTGRVQ